MGKGYFSGQRFASLSPAPSLEIGESGTWGANAEWGDSSGSGRARGALKGPPAWAQLHTPEPGANPENWRCWARVMLPMRALPSVCVWQKKRTG